MAWVSIGEPVRMPGVASLYADAECSCGLKARVRVSAAGAPRSVGCKKCGDESRRRHGHCPFRKPSPEYRTWQGMIARCANPRSAYFSNYGGRGIKVCDRWLRSFDAFIADMGPRPSGLTIERIDNDGNYEPGNCRWATRTEQNRNSRNCHKLALNGVVMTTAEWARKLAVRSSLLRGRIHRGWSDERVLTEPFDDWVGVRRRTRGDRLIEYAGLAMTSGEWAKRTGLGRTTIQERIRSGWSAERALTTPSRGAIPKG